MRFRFAKDTGRCTIPCVSDHARLDPALEPLRSLRMSRAGYYPHLPAGHALREPEAFFAVNLIGSPPAGPNSAVELRVDDEITVHTWRRPTPLLSGSANPWARKQR